MNTEGVLLTAARDEDPRNTLIKNKFTKNQNFEKEEDGVSDILKKMKWMLL